MTEQAHSPESYRWPTSVSLGPALTERHPGRYRVGKLYDKPGQTLKPANGLHGNAGLSSHDDWLVSDRSHRGLGFSSVPGSFEHPHGQLLLKTVGGHTFWIEDGFIVDIDTTQAHGTPVVYEPLDCQALMTIDEPWGYKYKDENGGVKWRQIDRLKEVASFALEFADTGLIWRGVCQGAAVTVPCSWLGVGMVGGGSRGATS
jgi:hypothetical protein